MSSTLRVIGFVEPNKEWALMFGVWSACDAAGVLVPHEVRDFFNGERPSPYGPTVEIATPDWNRNAPEQGIEIHLASLPAGVRVLRVFCD